MTTNDISAAAAALGRKGGGKNTPAQAEARRENGKKGGRPGHYYALYWSHGRGTTFANGGGDACYVLRFPDRKTRDEAAANYTAPNHCPTAAIEPVTSRDPRVRAAIALGVGYTWDPEFGVEPG